MTTKDFDTLVHEAHCFLNQAGERMPNTGDWQYRHLAAWNTPRAFERQIRDMISAWALYGQQHFRRYETLIGDDGVLGREWERIGKGLRALLNGETGGFDCGTLDGLILDIAANGGVDTKEW